MERVAEAYGKGSQGSARECHHPSWGMQGKVPGGSFPGKPKKRPTKTESTFGYLWYPEAAMPTTTTLEEEDLLRIDSLISSSFMAPALGNQHGGEIMKLEYNHLQTSQPPPVDTKGILGSHFISHLSKKSYRSISSRGQESPEEFKGLWQEKSRGCVQELAPLVIVLRSPCVLDADEIAAKCLCSLGKALYFSGSPFLSLFFFFFF
nr:Stathmin 1/oncoprotein 18 [Homo sapiens]